MAQSFLGLSSDALKKYRSLIISLFFLVLIAVSSILASLYFTSLYNRAFSRYSGLTHAIDLHHDFLISLQATADPNNSASTRLHFADMAVNSYDDLKRFYPSFVNGGAAQYGSSKILKDTNIASPLDDEDKKNSEELYNKVLTGTLQPREALIERLRKANSSTFDSDKNFDLELNTEMDSELVNWASGDTAFTKLRENLQNRAEKYNQVNRFLTLSSILVLLSYFALIGLNNLRRLVKSDEEVETARRETDDIMKNVNTGLFLLDKDLRIGNQYSSELEKILGSKEIAGQNLTKLLSNKVSAKDLETTSEFVEQLYNALVREKLLGDLNPLQRIMVMDDKQKSHFLDFKFSRIYHQKNIEKVLVSVQDITTQVKLEQKLEQEREQNNLQVDMLTTILNVSPALIEEFIDNTQQNVTKMNNILKQQGASQSDLTNKLNALYRIIHSLKGEASALKLHNFVKIATNFEEKLKFLQGQSKLSGNDFLPLTIYLDEMLHLANTIDALGKRIAENVSYRETKNFKSKDLEPNSFETKNNGLSDESDARHDDFLMVTADNSAKANHKSQFYQQLVENVALRQGKKVALTTAGMDDILLPKAVDSVFKDIMIQLLRNAVVHGIETPAVRLQHGKPETGIITMTLREQADAYNLSFEDDGQGLNHSAIRARALAMGYNKDEIMQWDDNKLISVLFRPGFSTYQTDDEDAGRGMGMDIIKERIQELGGKIAINTEVGKFTRFTIHIPKTPTL